MDYFSSSNNQLPGYVVPVVIKPNRRDTIRLWCRKVMPLGNSTFLVSDSPDSFTVPRHVTTLSSLLVELDRGYRVTWYVPERGNPPCRGVSRYESQVRELASRSASYTHELRPDLEGKQGVVESLGSITYTGVLPCLSCGVGEFTAFDRGGHDLGTVDRMVEAQYLVELAAGMVERDPRWSYTLELPVKAEANGRTRR